MRQAAIATLAALLLVACDATVFEPVCVPEMREARERYGQPSRISDYQATGYSAITYYWRDQHLSMRFVASRGRGGCDVSTYRGR